MFWAGLTIVVLGLLLGACFPVPALVAVSAILVIVNIAWSVLAGHPVGSAVFTTLALLAILQCAYLVGLLLAAIVSRVRNRTVL